MKNNKLDRRTFLRSSAAVGAGLYLAPKTFGAGSDSKTDDINVALLGVGLQGQTLLDASLNIPGLRFKAVCDIWAKYNRKRVSGTLRKLKHEHNTYVDFREMLDKEKDLDAVLIATPDFWHAEQTIACLEAGLDVYCEKEMSNTLEGAKSMVEAANRTGKLLQIGHQRRSNPRYIYCYEQLIKEAKILGRITTVNGQWNRSVQPDLGSVKKLAIDQVTLEKYGFESMHQFRNWRWYKGLGGGPIVDLGSHQIDIFAWFLGTNPKSVLASGGTDYYDKETHQWYDNVLAIYEYQTPTGTVRASYQTLTTNSNGGYFETFMGDEGTLSLSESAARGDLYCESWVEEEKWEKFVRDGLINAPVEVEVETEAILDVRETPTPPSYKLPITMDKPYHQPHLENFFDAVRGRAELNCPAQIGYETAVAVLKVNDAAEAGCKLDFAPGEFEA